MNTFNAHASINVELENDVAVGQSISFSSFMIFPPTQMPPLLTSLTILKNFTWPNSSHKLS